MSKNKRKQGKKTSKWLPTKGASAFFSPESDFEFQANHPVGYTLLVLLGIVALFLPVVLYLIFVIPLEINSPWMVLGFVGSFIIGVGLFNFVAIIIRQYLGHLVSVFSFLIGGIFVCLSLIQMGII